MHEVLIVGGGFAGLNAFLAREELAEDGRTCWGRIHPAFMGGEYLPRLSLGEVEIARISLASVTSDQISIRAIHAGDKIQYAIHDEYQSEYELAFEDSRQPLTLAELIDALEAQHAGLKERLCDETGELRRFVNVYINGEDVRFLAGLDTAIESGAEVSIVPAVAGG